MRAILMLSTAVVGLGVGGVIVLQPAWTPAAAAELKRDVSALLNARSPGKRLSAALVKIKRAISPAAVDEPAAPPGPGRERLIAGGPLALAPLDLGPLTAPLDDLVIDAVPTALAAAPIGLPVGPPLAFVVGGDGGGGGSGSGGGGTGGGGGGGPISATPTPSPTPTSTPTSTPTPAPTTPAPTPTPTSTPTPTPTSTPTSTPTPEPTTPAPTPTPTLPPTPLPTLTPLPEPTPTMTPTPPQVGAVPEPATWLSLLVGFAILAGALRRRNWVGRKARAA